MIVYSFIFYHLKHISVDIASNTIGFLISYIEHSAGLKQQRHCVHWFKKGMFEDFKVIKQKFKKLQKQLI